ncbi:MAG: hypothetical protein RSE43_02275 [Oscillospiraceae bacterium]
MEITFEKSLFLKEIKKIYPVFIVDKSSSNTVEKIRYVDSFSFANYETEAEQVFNQTLEAFVEGDESKFPKSGSNLGFHIRPKAINGEDTFEFTNGNHITKRTFWANKDTVEAILEDKLNKGYSTNGAADLK